MSSQMLRKIRVASKEELIERIELYLSEVNADPVPQQVKVGIDPPGEDDAGRRDLEIVSGRGDRIRSFSLVQ